MSEIKRPLSEQIDALGLALARIEQTASEQIEELSDQIAALGLALARIEQRVKAALTPPLDWAIPESQGQADYLAEKNPRDRVKAFREAAEGLYGGDRRG